MTQYDISFNDFFIFLKFDSYSLFRIASDCCTFIFESTVIETKKKKDVYELKIQRKNKEIETINASSIINCAGLNSYNIAKKIMNQNLLYSQH